MNAKPLALAIASLAAVVVAYGPLLRDFSFGLWAKPHYQHFPFVLLAAVLLCVARLRSPEASDLKLPNWLTYAAYGLAWSLLGVAYIIPSPLLAAASLIVLVGGWLLRVSQQLGQGMPLGPWLLLWLILPPPLGLDRSLMQQLQRSSSTLSSYFLDLVGIDHLMDGNALVLPDKQLFVDEACSGIISVVSILTCAAMYGVWRRRGVVHTLLLIGLAAGWATLLNVVRISSIAVAWSWGGIDWSAGNPHTLLGLAVFALSLLTLAATDWFLKAALAEIEPRWDHLSAEPLNYGAQLVGWWDALVAHDPDAEGTIAGWQPLSLSVGAISLGIAPTIAFAGLGVAQLMNGSSGPVIVGERLDLERFSAKLQDDGTMPDSLAGLELQDIRYENRSASSRFGEYSVLFDYRTPEGKQYVVSCDYPFNTGWHELSVCYSGIGWQVDERTVVQAEGAEPFSFAQLDLAKPDGRNALVSFTACYADGTPIEAPTNSLMDRLGRSLRRGQRAHELRQSVQMQILTETTVDITASDRDISKRLLDESRQRFVRAMQESRKTP